MNISAPFIVRPVGTTLLVLAIALVGIVAYTLLPVSPLPQVDFATIRVPAPSGFCHHTGIGQHAGGQP